MSKQPPFGKRDGGVDDQGRKVWIDDPQEQEVVRRVLDLRTNGHTLPYAEIARLFNAEGVPCRGQKWHHTSVQRIERRYREN